jgi:ATP-dependent Clp protease ATP-binding subunit ClpB
LDDIAKIVQLQIQQIAVRLAQQNIGLDSTPEAIEWLAKKGFDPQFGARPVKRALQTHVLNALSKELLSGNISSQKNILIDAFDDQLVFRNATPKDV